MTDNTYPQPPDGWVCFHCGERFTDRHKAGDHFGPTPASKPACSISIGLLFRELREYRWLEKRFGILDERNRKVYESALARKN